MSIREIARGEVVTVAPETSVEEVARIMREHNVGSVVVSEASKAQGLVTDRDLGVGVWDLDEPTAATAADVMSGDLFTVEADASIYDALEGAREAGVRRIPVTDDGDLFGIVTLDDIIVLLAGELEEVSGVIQAESPPY